MVINIIYCMHGLTYLLESIYRCFLLCNWCFDDFKMLCVVTLALGSQLNSIKAKTWKGQVGWENVLKFEHTTKNVKKWILTLASDFPTLKIRILNFWNKSANNKYGPNWVSNIPLERSWNLDIKNETTFFIWSCDI